MSAARSGLRQRGRLVENSLAKADSRIHKPGTLGLEIDAETHLVTEGTEEVDPYLA